MRRRAPAVLVATLAAVILSGCGAEEGTPAACLEGPRAYLNALERAPGKVRLAGGTPISSCLVEDQEAGDLGRVGESMIAAAHELNRTARRKPESDQTVRLGYLVGAVQRGAAETGGIHTDLVRRLDTAVRAGQTGLGADFERTFGRGFEAARKDG